MLFDNSQHMPVLFTNHVYQLAHFVYLRILQINEFRVEYSKTQHVHPQAILPLSDHFLRPEN